ncbi:RNA polymerase sigma factor [Granulicella sp. S156]|jgi:RNA polymerase sigma-70 factor (ECF subfamily)|uniref:RNA polymerase sigma factor n=1 Tax=Granulicella sp. S156 TaxID=1747224 RepID=UPI00131DFE27|nr:sigma-70 family RNA polymerase sigma factor [Granulicella sp. S156]
MRNIEQEAIRSILAGDRDAYRVLMERHLPAVLRVTSRITGNPVDAEEAAQEAFLRAYNKLPEFREQAAFGTWVYRIAMNCALNLVERRSRDLGWNAVALDDEPRAENIAVSHGPTPEAELLDREAVSQREHAMQALTPMERTAFVLRHVEDQSMSVIATALGVPVNSAKQAVFRAVSKLRRELAPVRQVSAIPISSMSLAKERR